MFGILEVLVIFAIGILAYVFCEIVKWFIKNQSIWVCWLVLVIIAAILIVIPFVVSA